jgi:hypothetical protein
MRGRSFRGAIADGDWVEVRGGLLREGAVLVDAVWNHTTGSTVRAESWRSPRWLVAVVAVGVLVVLALTAVVIVVMVVTWRNVVGSAAPIGSTALVRLIGGG